MIAQNADQSPAFGYNNVAKTAGLAVASSLPYRITVGPDDNLYVGDGSATQGNVYQVSPNLTGSAALFLGNSGQSSNNASANLHGESLSKPFASFAGGNLTITATDGFLSIPVGATPEFQGIYQYTIPTSSIPTRGSTVTPGTAKPTTVLVGNPTTNTTTSGLNTFVGGLVADLAIGPKDARNYFIQNQSNGTAKAGLYVVDNAGNTLYDSLVASGGATASSGGTLTGTPDRLTQVNGVAISPDNKYLAFIVTATNVAPATNGGNALIVLPLDATIGGVSGLPDLASEIYIPNVFATTAGNGRDIAFDSADNIYAVSSGAGQFRVFSPGGATTYTTGFDGANYSFAAATPEPASLALLSLGSLALIRRRKPKHTCESSM